MDRLLKLTARLLTRRMGLKGAALFIYNEKRDRFEIKGAEGEAKELVGYTMSSNYPLIEALEESKKMVFRHDIEEKMTDVFLLDDEKRKLQSVISDFDKIHVILCVPSIIKNNVVAFLALGEKMSGDTFNEDDLNFLETLANQSAIFLENSMLLEREKDSAKKLAEAQIREQYTATLEKVNKELIETREQLVKSERLSTLTRLTVSLQHEINNPLTSVLAQTQALLLKMQNNDQVPMEFIREVLRRIDTESRRIRDLLKNLAHITEPIVKEYMPGVEMIDINASPRDDGTK
jgi:signal transduction histidine kinase